MLDLSSFVSVAAATLLLVLACLAIVALISAGPAHRCPHCATESELVGEIAHDLGGGWLKCERTYVCPSCRTASRHDHYAGPLDYLTAV